MQRFTQDGRLLRDLDIRFPYWFYGQLDKLPNFKFSDEVLEYLSIIEHAEPRNEECTVFSSPFGDRLRVDEFSYGTKTFLSVLYDIAPGSIYEMTSAGPNVWAYLFNKYPSLEREIFSEYFPAIGIPQTGIVVNGELCLRSGDAFVAFEERV